VGPVDPRDVEGMERLATLCRQYGGDNDSPATLIGPWRQFFNSGFAPLQPTATCWSAALTRARSAGAG
jgi:hypothetical protein